MMLADEGAASKRLRTELVVSEKNTSSTALIEKNDIRTSDLQAPNVPFYRMLPIYVLQFALFR